MKRSELKPMPQYFDRYINLVEDVDLSTAFEQSIAEIEEFNLEDLRRLQGKTYAAGKWTVNSVVGHVMDFERILSYRTLLFARNAGITPQGIDEHRVADNSNVNELAVDQILAELKAVRVSTMKMFENFDGDIFIRVGTNWNYEISVAAMGFNIIGHQIHHFRVIRERYFPLLGEGSANVFAA